MLSPPTRFGNMKKEVLAQNSTFDRNVRARKEMLCLVSCSALKAELQELVKRGDLDADLVFVSKLFHGDYAQLEKNLRKTLKRTLSRSSRRVILIYGDLCLGPNNEMKGLAEEYGISKVDAVTCMDCLVGGRGKIFEVDPTNKLLLLDPGMIGFYKHLKDKARQEGLDDDTFKQFFSSMKGIMFLDTLGEVEKNKKEIDELNFGLEVLETKKIGYTDLKFVILEAIERNSQTGIR